MHGVRDVCMYITPASKPNKQRKNYGIGPDLGAIFARDKKESSHSHVATESDTPSWNQKSLTFLNFTAAAKQKETLNVLLTCSIEHCRCC